MAGRVAYHGGLVTDGLVLHLDAARKPSYPGSGDVWYDMSGNGNHGILTNGPSFDKDRNSGTFEFDGSNDYVNFPGSDTLNIRGSISVGAFTKATTSTWTPYWNFVSKYNQYILGINSANQMAFLVYSDTWYPPNYNSGIWGQSNNTPTDYHYYVGTYNTVSGILAMYVDGVETASFNIGTQTLNNDTGKMLIGSREVTGGYYLPKITSNVQIYNRALSASEVLQNYNALKGRFGL